MAAAILNRFHLTRHAPGDLLTRHGHDSAFLALVLQGAYVEAGDSGLHRVEPGDVLFHHPWEHHLDRFDRRGAVVMVLPAAGWSGPLRGRVADPDAVVRTAERDEPEAMALLQKSVTELASGEEDWPDMLARALLDDPNLSLSDWAAGMALHPGSLSRGFVQQFGITPAAYRAAARTRRAIRALGDLADSLAAIAADCGFADQAHMTRSIAAMTGLPPGRLRRR